MALQIRSLSQGLAPILAGRYSGSSALDLAESPELLLRFLIEISDPDELEALRHARRSMLREEWTRGRDPEEPSLEDAIFSPAGISWRVRLEQRAWCLQKIEELASRGSRFLAQIRASHRSV